VISGLIGENGFSLSLSLEFGPAGIGQPELDWPQTFLPETGAVLSYSLRRYRCHVPIITCNEAGA